MTRFSTRTLVLPFLLLAGRPNLAAAEPPPTSPPTSTEAEAPPESPDASAPVPEVPQVVENTLPDKPAEVPPIPTLSIPQKGLPRLRIEADRPGVRLLRIERVMSDDTGEGILATTVCTAPCDQVIDGRRRQTFFFGAKGMVPSRGFKLSRIEGDIVAHVHGGSFVARQMGYLLGGLGGAAVIGGVTMLGVGYSNNGAHLSNEGKIVEGPNTNLTTGGFVVLGAGVALVTTAIVLIATAKTRITLVHADDKSARVTFEMGTLRF